MSDECLVRLKKGLSGVKPSRLASRDLVEFNSCYEKLMSWLMQKEKMSSLLVPIGCQLPVLRNQLLQSRVCRCVLLSCVPLATQTHR